MFSTRRKAENLEMYSSYIHLDYDKLSSTELLSIKEIVSACPFTVLAFVSPSGDGLKVFIEVNSGSEQHALAYQQVKDYYNNLLPDLLLMKNVRTLPGFVLSVLIH
ncbi:MAG: hypothetical protein IPJ13_06300 [Saprospiraceae bacterium]|nr:hypothetical protein [Saprospiraceae bacterium]